MRSINELIWHCTATPEGREVTVAEIDLWHKQRGWNGIGYHKVVHLDGSVSNGRPIATMGAHVKGHNRGTIGYVYVGGLDKSGNPKDTRTDAQKATMIRLSQEAVRDYGIKKISGHRDYAAKACPCFDASGEYRWIVTGIASLSVFAARFYAKGKEAEQAKRTQEALKRLRERMKSDETIARMSATERRRRLSDDWSQ